MDKHILEDELQAFIDGRLQPERAREVAAYLRQHPETAGRIEAYARQRSALREALQPIADEPIPPALNLRSLMEARGRPRNAPWAMAAAVILSIALGGTGGWQLRGADASGPRAGGIAALSQEATLNYEIYASDPIRPVELGPDREAELAHWIAQRIRRPVAIPDLGPSGYRFIGGRVVSTDHGPAGLLLYEDAAGTRIGMMVRPMAADANSPMVGHSHRGVAGYSWSRQGMGFSLVSRDSVPGMHGLADEMRRQIDRGNQG